MATCSVTPALAIARKRDGYPLTQDEIASFVQGAVDGSWASYQLSAMLMAITLKGMTDVETTALTLAVLNSGQSADLSRIKKYKIDKHSTGGVGDKISIHLAPMLAACGVAVPMISGRGLGHTGGTLDKLDSIPGFKTNLTLTEFIKQVEQLGVCLIGQTAELAPADKTLYSLRDVTATVECIPLICASIMGKKLAEGIDGLVLDVKFGRGSFNKTVNDATYLAERMVSIGKAMGKNVRALLTSMEEPLGHAVGNALEIEESIACLKGNGPLDVMEITYSLGEHMLVMANAAPTLCDARKKLENSVKSGEALHYFKALIKAQGGDDRVVDSPQLLPKAKFKKEILSTSSGFIQSVDPLEVALATVDLGAGRHKAEDRIDPAVGVSSLGKIGQAVTTDSVVAVVHANDEALLQVAAKRISNAFSYSQKPVNKPKLIEKIVGL